MVWALRIDGKHWWNSHVYYLARYWCWRDFPSEGNLFDIIETRQESKNRFCIMKPRVEWSSRVRSRCSLKHDCSLSFLTAPLRVHPRYIDLPHQERSVPVPRWHQKPKCLATFCIPWVIFQLLKLPFTRASQQSVLSILLKYKFFVHFSLFWHRVSFFLFSSIQVITIIYKNTKKRKKGKRFGHIWGPYSVP